MIPHTLAGLCMPRWRSIVIWSLLQSTRLYVIAIAWRKYHFFLFFEFLILHLTLFLYRVWEHVEVIESNWLSSRFPRYSWCRLCLNILDACGTRKVQPVYRHGLFLLDYLLWLLCVCLKVPQCVFEVFVESFARLFLAGQLRYLPSLIGMWWKLLLGDIKTLIVHWRAAEHH